MFCFFSHRSFLAALPLGWFVALPLYGQETEIKTTDSGATITVEGVPFAAYLLHSGH